jgi:hypothetical protein
VFLVTVEGRMILLGLVGGDNIADWCICVGTNLSECNFVTGKETVGGISILVKRGLTFFLFMGGILSSKRLIKKY